MDKNERIGNSLLDLVQAAAYNRETATYKGDLDREGVEELDCAFRKAVDLARAMGVSEVLISKAELLGKLKAAIEAGNKEMEKFYRQSIDDLGIGENDYW